MNKIRLQISKKVLDNPILLLILIGIIINPGCENNNPSIDITTPDDNLQIIIPQGTQTPANPEQISNSPLDKWGLWNKTTQLRGANTWQRIVIPNLDGEEFLGSDYIGPPYTQEDFNQLAALGANYVNISGYQTTLKLNFIIYNYAR